MTDDINALVAHLATLTAQQKALTDMIEQVQRRHATAPDNETEVRLQVRAVLFLSSLAELEQAVSVQGRELHWQLNYLTNEFIPAFITNK